MNDSRHMSYRIMKVFGQYITGVRVLPCFKIENKARAHTAVSPNKAV